MRTAAYILMFAVLFMVTLILIDYLRPSEIVKETTKTVVLTTDCTADESDCVCGRNVKCIQEIWPESNLSLGARYISIIEDQGSNAVVEMKLIDVFQGKTLFGGPVYITDTIYPKPPWEQTVPFVSN